MELTFAFDICACLLGLFCIVYELRRRKSLNRQNKVFLILNVAIVLGAAVAVVSNVIQAVPSMQTESFRFALYSTRLLYFLIHNLIPAIYAFYVRTVFGLDANTTWKKELLFFAPGIVTALIVFLNIPFNWVFRIDENLKYAREYMTYALYLLAGVYLLISFYYLMHFRAALQKRALYSIYIYYAITIFGILFQMIVPRMKVEQFFEALSIVGLLMTFEEDEILHDPVTGVFNRMAFRRDVTRYLATGQSFYCVNVNFLNMRFYARIMRSETFQTLLNDIAAWMRGLHRRSDVYHFDENFTLLLFVPHEEEARAVVEEMEKRLETPWNCGLIEAQFQSFVGVAKAPEDMDTYDAVLDLIEYEPENKGAHVTVQYRESLQYVKREAAVERALRNAVMNRAFQVYYQPIYNCETGRISCAEALVRLFDDELGNISPGEFIPIAEKSALIVEIGNIVFEKVCRFLQEEQPEQYGIDYTEVNLSVAQFMQSDLVERFSQTLKEYGIAAKSINLEITESVASDSTEPFMLAIRQLENLGFTFSMDDYGTGYSNISSILNVNFTNIKMDKSFLAKALENDAGKSILRDTARLIRNLGRNVLQEGVETREELSFVQDAGCNLVQGYYFSRPLPEADFLEFVKKFNRVA